MNEDNYPSFRAWRSQRLHRFPSQIFSPPLACSLWSSGLPPIHSERQTCFIWTSAGNIHTQHRSWHDDSWCVLWFQHHSPFPVVTTVGFNLNRFLWENCPSDRSTDGFEKQIYQDTSFKSKLIWNIRWAVGILSTCCNVYRIFCSSFP